MGVLMSAQGTPGVVEIPDALVEQYKSAGWTETEKPAEEKRGPGRPAKTKE